MALDQGVEESSEEEEDEKDLDDMAKLKKKLEMAGKADACCKRDTQLS